MHNRDLVEDILQLLAAVIVLASTIALRLLLQNPFFRKERKKRKR